MKKFLLTAVLSAGLFTGSAFITSCDNANKDSDETATTEQTETNAETEAPSEAQTVEIDLAADGNTMADMRYDKEEIRVPAGSTVHLKFVNHATDGAMLHNWVLVKDGTMEKVAMDGMKAGKDADFVAAGDADVIAHTKVLDPGGNTDITFDAPAKGTYQFTCTYPGHWQKMHGTFIVE